MYENYFEVEIFKIEDDNYNPKYNRQKMAELISVLHKIFAIENDNYAISFPQYDMQQHTLGDIVRVFHHHTDKLECLQEKIKQMISDVDEWIFSSVSKVPTKRIRQVSQYKKMAVKNPQQQQKQFLRGAIKKSTVEKSNSKSIYPYVFIKSNSSDNIYPLIIRKEVFNKSEVDITNNKFNKYGFGGNSNNNSYVAEW